MTAFCLSLFKWLLNYTENTDAAKPENSSAPLHA